jgi:hypothetical protein
MSEGWRPTAGHPDVHLVACSAAGGLPGSPDWGLGLAPEVASLLAVSAMQSFKLLAGSQNACAAVIRHALKR